MNNATPFEDRAGRSRSRHEGESSSYLCDRLSRTRVPSQRQLPTNQDYAVSTREYQTDQSSITSAPTSAGLVLEQQQKRPHGFAAIDWVTPYQVRVADNSPRIVASAATYCAVYNCARMALTPGAKLGTYWIQFPLGAGGMGEVYRATCTLHWR